MAMMSGFRLALGQFEPVVRNRDANLDKIRALTERAAGQGAKVVCFQEQAIGSYDLFATSSTGTEVSRGDEGRIAANWGWLGEWMYELAEPVPQGPSTRCLIDIAARHKVVLMAGVPELAADNNIYNAYVIVGPQGFIGRYHKCHLVPGGEHIYFKAGHGFPVFDIGPCRAGVLICYDNHFPEAHRILALRGAQMIVMPHVTTGHGQWRNLPPQEARQQARHWILTWLRARAFDNSVYCAFVNQGSADGDGCLGCCMVVNPEGHVIAETNTYGEDLVLADIDAKLFYDVRRRTHHYMRYRRPELYGPLADPAFGAQWYA